ncbi:cell division control protein 48 homolog C-like [Vicia villosa]|uniref:cell division control protein 48 homolog C-like n=1 Tax=Vicia villosa TaxID=3911 RepID=UPI00273B8A54|nr:cell division control protein 48 homolog C-like [Vicia villosa]
MRLKKNNMGRRNGGGGGGGGGGRSLQFALRRRVELCKSKYKTAEEIVDHLRSNYPDYHRTKSQTLVRFVEDALQHSNNTPTRKHNPINNADDDDEEDENENRSASRKRRKESKDESEDRLQKMEALHIKARMSKQVPSTSSSSDSASASDDDEEGAVSTSEDGIYSEKVEPAFDLMKDMLRHSYTGATKSKSVSEVEEKEKEKNVELDIGNSSKATITVNVDGGKSKSTATEGKHSKGSVSNTGGGGEVEVKGKEGPTFKDLGGMKAILEELMMDIVSLCNPQLPRHLGVRPVTGILLHGPPGCGKTRLAHAIANETGLPFHHISATEVVSGVSGASEEYIRELFDKAKRTAPSIVFIDEIDAIASKRENLQREMEKRIVTQLMTSMDEPESSEEPRGYVLVIGATNRPDSLDPALRRPGRFDREFLVGVPDESARVEILSVVTRNLKLDGSFDLHKIARSTPGFVGADLTALANKAGNLAMKRILNERKRELSQDITDEDTQEWWKEPWLPEEINKLAIKMSDFEEAAKMVQPSARREGFSSIPNVKWEDVGGLDLLRHEFDRYIVKRIKYPELYEGIGMNLESGFLLYGPPGCGKTLIAKAVANEAGANFIHIKGPELLNKYVGESELAVRTLFSRARTCAPCVLFFDEVDALTTERGKEGGWVIERLLNQLLIELDGAENRRGVFVIGATNRPEVMDRALLRPGRFGKLLYVPLPSSDDRVLILKALARNKPIDSSVDLSAIGRMESCENLSGADLAQLMGEAVMAALDEKLSSTETTSLIIKASHFELALSKASPSVSDKQRQYYERLSKSLRAA